MRKGVIVLRPPEASPRQQSQVCLALSHNGFSVEARQRFDNVLIVAFTRDEGEPDLTADQMREIINGVNEDFDDANMEIKSLGKPG